jgi:DNA-binding Lrp family transcriptional regulator
LILNDLDRKLIKYLSGGINSYEDLAHQCEVTRNTVYRHIAALERQGIIRNTTRCILNFEQLDISAICIAAKISPNNLNTACQELSAHKSVRLLLRSFGNHNVNLVAFCKKGKEGEFIQSITKVFESFNVTDLDISVGFTWVKSDLEFIEDQMNEEQESDQLIKITK